MQVFKKYVSEFEDYMNYKYILAEAINKNNIAKEMSSFINDHTFIKKLIITDYDDDTNQIITHDLGNDLKNIENSIKSFNSRNVGYDIVFCNESYENTMIVQGSLGSYVLFIKVPKKMNITLPE